MKTETAEYYVRGVLRRDRRVLAQAITLIESCHPDHQETARAVLDQLLPHTGKVIRLGITGVPGAGKSTFIESLGTRLVERGHRVAVLAVDPSSTRSGGSILADKTRMEKLSASPHAFIRPSPSGGCLGGVARKTRETMIACEAAGFDVLIVETVGVGQSEAAVASMVDFFLILMLAGAGDDIQAIKKGVLELADAVAVNKADGDNVVSANRVKSEYERALHLLRPLSPTWFPPVLTCSALTTDGVDAVWNTVTDHRKKFNATGELAAKRREQAVDWMWSLVEEGLRQRFHRHPEIKKALTGALREVEKGTVRATAAACDLLDLLEGDGNHKAGKNNA